MIGFRHILPFLTILLSAVAFCPQSHAAKPAKSAKSIKSTKAAKTAVNTAQLLEDAQSAFEAYEFARALKLLESFDDNTDNASDNAVYTDLRRRAELGLTMLERVERIAIIDSITVDRDRFFEAYRLSPTTGSINPNEDLDPSLQSEGNPTVYVSEDADMVLWSAPTADGRQLVSSHLLTDGSWEQPVSLGEAINMVQNPAYPFLMADGSTLYFAAQGDESLGGYDIFISRNNGDEFLQPQNMGMPYNSPFDDYLLVIDELTGAGWWATDRNRIPGKLTIYVFVPQELRVNYPVDDPDISDRARIATIAGTGDPSIDRSAVLKAIAALSSDDNKSTSRDFDFALPGGRIIHSLDELSNSEAREAMKTYLDRRLDLIVAEDNLAELRDNFASGAQNAREILEAEQQLDSIRIEIRQLANAVVRAELGR
ncbi:MAG: hypothetical protein NC111_03115 [Bacteroides sp.]|nr:hypothetical protein [Bacteroides sp.]MCM1412841.1 hypothetical protein [Bacteroides sp.]MCM1471510.1 hypothetical protein [Bacteroides sp.]